MSGARTLLPHRRWLAATLVVALLSAGGAFTVHRQICAINRNHFEVAVEAVEININDRIGALNLISTAFLLLVSPDGGGITLETLEEMMDGDPAASLASFANVAALISAFPWDGLSALSIATQEPDGSLSTVMLPNVGGLTEETLATPAIETAILEAIATGQPITSHPFATPTYERPLYSRAIPMSETRVLVSFVNPDALVEDAIEGSGADLLHAQVWEVETDTLLVFTGLSNHPDVTSDLEIALFDRRWALSLTPGPDFRWQSSTLPWLSTFALGMFFAGLVFMVGLLTRRRSEHQELQLQHAARINEDKDRFIAAVSHELRTPLTTLVGLSAAMAATPDGFRPDEISEFGDTMAQQSKEMAMLVEDLLVAARTDVGTISVTKRPVDLATEIQSTLEGLGDQSIGITLLPGTGGALADPLRVRQIVRNLLTNAKRHGGPAITARAFAGPEWAHIEVCDNGPGIPPEARHKIFEPYYRSLAFEGPAPSVGLGLTVSRQLAGLMGGEIEYSYEDGASTFRLTLPAMPPADPPQEHPPVRVAVPT